MTTNNKRLAIEMQMLSKIYDVELVDDDITRWQIAVPGPDATPFFGCTFLIEITFPITYPFTHPTISFKTLIYHPNISKKGEICLGALSSDWKPKNTVMEIMTFITNLLAAPDPNNPLEPQIAAQYISNRDEYETQARLLAHKYAV
jgi:ubiquitin-protein ligase